MPWVRPFTASLRRPCIVSRSSSTLARLHAPFGERPVTRFLEQLGGVEQRLGRDAADVEAGAAERLAAFGAGGLEAELRGADRGDIAAGAGADHQDVEIVIRPFTPRSPAKVGVQFQKQETARERRLGPGFRRE